VSLRARLTLGLIFLAAIGIVTIDIVNYTSLHDFLLDRSDQSLNSANYSVTTALQEGLEQAENTGPDAVKSFFSATELAQLLPSLAGAIQGDCVQIRTPQNTVVGSQCLSQFQQVALPPDPAYPVCPSVPRKADVNGDRVRYLTVPAEAEAVAISGAKGTTGLAGPAGARCAGIAAPTGSTGATGPAGAASPPAPPATTAAKGATSAALPEFQHGGKYRVRVALDGSMAGYYLLLATPLTGVDSTLHRLLVIESLISAGVLLALAALGLWVVRLGLKPLESIGRTATEIAGGDLSRRVEQVDEKTEIGRLGILLNMMLGQIEAAFQSREAALQAREASELKLRRFVADASHELRTPVAAVRAYAELFSRGAAERPEDLERSMLGVKQASERMSALVDELFLLAHLDEGRALGREEVDLETVVTEACEVAKALEPERPITVHTRSTVVTGDPSRLRQLVDNLLANVRAHTPPATPLAVSLGHEGANAVLRVSDSGQGIDRASLPHVFERFYRAGVPSTHAGGGSGLGLAIVAALAEAHGGSATASSEPGQGATFTITIPLADSDPVAEP
jgi:signal transduction histidine kinase